MTAPKLPGALAALWCVAACAPSAPGPQTPLGTSRAPHAGGDAASVDPAIRSPDGGLDAGAPADAAEAGADGSSVPAGPVTLSPCMAPDAALAWAGGAGAPVVAAALARYLTDLRPESVPEVSVEEAAVRTRSIAAAPLADPSCASLLVTFGSGPGAAAGEGEGTVAFQGIALFEPALTEPVVSFALCADGRSSCEILRSDDVDGDGAADLLVERSAPGSGLPPSMALYTFPERSDPTPIWISDDDAVRCALFGREGDADPANQAEVGNVTFALEDDRPTIRADYRLMACPPAPATGGGESACEPAGAETLVFTRLGDVYLLPNEPEPGAPWGRPEEDGGAGGGPPE